MRKNKIITSCLPVTVIRDSKEKEGHGWIFRKSKYCAGTVIESMETGDYTLRGFEQYVTIERKESVTEFIGSMISANFKAELERMELIVKPFVVLEFSIEELIKWPASASLYNPTMRSRLPLQHADAALTKFFELKFKYPHVDFIFADGCGQRVVGNIFKRIIENYASQPDK